MCCSQDTNISSLKKMGIKQKCGIQKTQQPASELRWLHSRCVCLRDTCCVLSFSISSDVLQRRTSSSISLLHVPLDSWMGVYHIQSGSQDQVSNQQPDRLSEEKGLMSVATQLHFWGTEERGLLPAQFKWVLGKDGRRPGRVKNFSVTYL